MVCRLGVGHLHTIEQDKCLFETAPIHAYIRLCSKWTALANIHAAPKSQYFIDRLHGELSDFLPSNDLQVSSCLVKGYLQSILDRKSTRLNSSHVKISYAVFCLKKK